MSICSSSVHILWKSGPVSLSDLEYQLSLVLLEVLLGGFDTMLRGNHAGLRRRFLSSPQQCISFGMPGMLEYLMVI